MRREVVPVQVAGKALFRLLRPVVFDHCRQQWIRPRDPL